MRSDQSNLFSEARDGAPERLPTPNRALVVAAHPDDAEFGAGGLLTRWAAEGCEVSLLIATDGSKGSWDPDIDTAELIAARQREAAEAARVMGVSPDIVFLGHPDGELVHDMELRREVAGWIRRLRPDVVLGWDPWKRYMMHPDHREAGWVTVDAVVAAREVFFFPEQLVDGVTAHRPSAILLWAPDEPDYWEDITDSFDTKIDALLCHASQGQTTMQDAHAGDEHRAVFTARIREWCATMGAPVGIPVAEAFKLIRP